jgi:RHS repeat-associated protein
MCNVDISTGRLSLSAVDFDLPGRVPLTFKRHYRSTNLWLGDLGYGWAHPFGVALSQAEDGGIMFRGSDGRRIPFAVPAPKKPSLQPTEQISLHYFSPDELPWPALRSELSSGAFAVQRQDDPTLLFDARPAGEWFLWRGIASRSENLVLVNPGPDGLPAEIRDANGRILYLLRNRAGRLIEMQLAGDGPGAVAVGIVRYEYDGNYDLVAVSDSAGTRRYTYKDHLLIGHQDRCGGYCQSVFDLQGRCIQTSGPSGVLRRSYTFDPQIRMTKEEDSLGHVSMYAYSETHRVVETVDPAGGVSRFCYDADDRLVLAIDQLGNQTGIGYGKDGSPRGKVRPDGSVIGVDTDSLGEVTSITYPGGIRYKFQRDELGRVREQTVPAGGKYSYTYASNGDLTGIKLPSGKEGMLRWTPDGRTVIESDAEGVLTELHFDEFHRLTLLRDAVGATTRYGYDEAGYQAVIEHPDGTRRRFESDAEGRLVAIEDEAGNVTRWNYDDAGRRIGVTPPNGEAIVYRYDSENRLVAAEAPGGLQHRLAYDERGLLVWQQFADGRVERYEFDARGLLVKMIDSSGGSVDVERDKLGLIRHIVYPDGSEKHVENDDSGAWALIQVGIHVLERKINDKGHAVSERQDDFVLKRGFSETGRVTELADAGGRKVTYQYDENDRVASIQAGAPGSERRTHRFEYDRVGNQVAWFMPSGKVERKSYDLRRRLIEQSVWLGQKLLLRRNYKYDPAGRLLTLRDTERDEQAYSYDSLGRLLSVRKTSGAAESYQYSETGDLQSNGLQYATGNRVIRARNYELFYDARGFVTRRVSSSGTDDFSYLWNGMLTEARLADGKRIQYEYDPHYRLLQRASGDSQTSYAWNDEQLWSLSERGTPPMHFVYLPDAISPLEQQIGGQSYSIHTDHVGKIQELIDDQGQILWRWEGNAWGEPAPSVSAAAFQCPFGFPGQIRDHELGIFYNRYRCYFPQSAHFLSPDPVGLWAGIDQYRYPSDPVNFIDPEGLKCRGKNDDPILYRGDRRPPSEICAKGFKAKNEAGTLSVFEHVEGKGGSQFVSTSHDRATAERFAKGGPVYVINNPGCGTEVDCDPDVMAKYGPDPASTEHEIAFNKAIPPGNVAGFFPPTAGGYGPFQACP